jgi:hypothetical protein
MSKTCVCGRIGEHCPSAGCGSINKHPMIQRSLFISKQVGADVRFYRCRKCGTEYGFLNGALFDAECNAPEEIRLGARQIEPVDEVKMIKEAIALLESKGLKVSMADDTSNVPVIQKIPSEGEELPPGWSYNDKGQKVGPLSMDDLFKPKEPSKDESNS